ncbi:hypothetical protein KJ765_01455 [Candidatus Micrarchaeota archaeon]|nr:hypothetical protein [Candidatus Micrarchaeota archaeon]
MDGKHLLLVTTFFFLGTFAGFFAAEGSLPQYGLHGSVQPVFSPGAEIAMVRALASAERSIDIELFQFTYSGLREALVLAVERGVHVRLILDPKIDRNWATAEFLKSKGVRVRWSSQAFYYTHSKYAVMDQKKVMVGSTNWSYNAMKRNREAAVIIEQAELAEAFERMYEADWNDAAEVETP